jgi:hypothetical protein
VARLRELKMDKNKYQDIFVMAKDNNKKKGGSLGAVFKLIQELADFEEKIEECAATQEMTVNREKISGFIGQLDEMYDVLFEMARGGIGAIRSNRAGGDEIEEDVVEEEEVVRPRVDKQPVMLNVPTVPKM